MYYSKLLSTRQRVCTSKGEKGRGWYLFHVKLNLADPCRTIPCQYHLWGMLGRQAGSTVSVYAQVQCREPKTGQQKVQFSRKTKSFVNMGMINLFLYHTRQPSQIKIFGLHPWLCHTTDKTLSSRRGSRASENFYHTRQPPRRKMCYVEAPIPCKLRTCYLSLITLDPCLN